MQGRDVMRAGVIALLLATPVGADEPVPTTEPLTEEARVRLRTVRMRIDPTAAGEPGACLALGQEDLIVTLRGERLEPRNIVEFERPKQPTVHALLIDTSGSMIGKLDFAKQAASAFVSELRTGHEKAMIASFDDNMILVQPATSDLETLHAAIDSLRVGGYTTMLDGLGYVFRELAGHDARPVVLLLSDGVDTASFYDHGDVMQQVKQLPELTVFTIGLELPPIDVSGLGSGTPKKFLQNLSRRTNGRFFDVPTGSGLERVFLRIREMLNNEAQLTVLDPDSGAEAGDTSPKVRSADPACRVRVYRKWKVDEDDPRRRPIIGEPEPPQLVALPPERRYRRLYVNRAYHTRHPGCATRLPLPDDEDDLEMIDAGWFAEALPGGIRGCLLDLTIETGLLYDTEAVTRVSSNGWLSVRTRRFEIAMPPLEQLPTDPVEWMDDLARHALKVANVRLETNPLHTRLDRHARPYYDYPTLVHGSVLLENRSRLVRAIWTQPEYRALAQRKLLVEADGKLRVLREKLRRAAPDVSDDVLDLVLYQSPEAQAILARASTPTELDLQSHLAAWLGDLPASELFARWETERIDRLLRDGATSPFGSSFHEEWRQLRRIFFVPSHTRVLALLRPVYDPQQDRVGFWRVLLPRPAWLAERIQGPQGNPDYDSLPLDLIPDLPLGYWLIERQLAGRRDLARYLGAHGYRVESLIYEPHAPSFKLDARKAFLSTKVVLTLVGDSTAPQGPLRSTWTAELELPKKGGAPQLEALSIRTEGDPELAAMTSPANR